jgi:hypothetical protein
LYALEQNGNKWDDQDTGAIRAETTFAKASVVKGRKAQ